MNPTAFSCNLIPYVVDDDNGKPTTQEAHMLNHANTGAVTPENFRRMIQSAAHWLDHHKETVDRMNVFPVPDGDTGTNMSLTMQSAEKFAMKADANDITHMADQMAYGALMGARGNSGVILSQILAGFAEVVKKEGALTGPSLAEAFAAGAEYAYRAVSSPKEGTILTVVREIGEAVMANRTLDPQALLRLGLDAGQASLEKTPELLPVLKQAGVLDAGGQGLLFILEGMAKGLAGDDIAPLFVHPETTSIETSMDNVFDHFFDSVDEIVYPYCTEFLIHTDSNQGQKVIDALKETYQDYGDSMVVVGAGPMVKVHIHTDQVGQVLGLAETYGELDDIKINNMRSQHRALQSDLPMESGPDMAIVVVSNGDGFSEIFKSLGVTKVIHGGQTMNPSTEDFLQAIDRLGAKKAFLLPNNKNIILAADQAARLTDNPHIHVLPTVSIPQGIAALLNYDPEADEETNLAAMTEAAKDVMTGEITVAVRDTIIDGLAIEEGKKMAMVDGDILSTHADTLEALVAIVDHAQTQGYSFIGLYAGQDVTEDQAEQALAFLEDQYPDLEFESHFGYQAVYDYIVSAEL